MSKMKEIFFLVAVLVLLTACTQQISDIKNEESIGKTVFVKGTVKNTIKIGKLSGFTLTDSEGGSISVSSETLPPEGDKVTVKGVLIKDTLFGYYVKAERIS